MDWLSIFNTVFSFGMGAKEKADNEQRTAAQLCIEIIGVCEREKLKIHRAKSRLSQKAKKQGSLEFIAEFCKHQDVLFSKLEGEIDQVLAIANKNKSLCLESSFHHWKVLMPQLMQMRETSKSFDPYVDGIIEQAEMILDGQTDTLIS